MMQKGYDRVNHRLVFYGATPGPSFWDAHWMKQNLPAFPKNARQSFVVRATRKYLPTGARVLEGGCGRGDNVYALQSIGYDAYGVDFAPATVAAIRDAMPELKISLGDVRHLEFPPGHFDGYWSLGVIEHFEEGYSSILAEMHRVVKPGGYVFATVPTMCAVRTVKAFLGFYACHDPEGHQRNEFYQYALSPRQVVQDFCGRGFELLAQKRLDGVKGLKDEISILRGPLQRLYDSRSSTTWLARAVVNCLTAAWAGHVAFYVFRRHGM